MAAWLAVARQAASVTRGRMSSQTSASQASKLIQRRGLASGEDHQGTTLKVKLGSEIKNNEKEGRGALYCSNSRRKK
ncbi:uncharacterized protein LOC113278063 isoform X2 [Papaver somniferum]|uniref:uncharacterized protein LOC113278063 isoform X2 n=1 Tax=Papaver somniferum TaxID=3469 RepID=UPI000E6FAE88|nr:uncharacterized protein LOC113278063 isoform X2 [Papaver somniferum]